MCLGSDRGRCVVSLPLSHSFGPTVNLNAGFAVGSTLVLLPRFDAGAALKIMERESITMFAGVPTMYWGYLEQLMIRSMFAVSPTTSAGLFPVGPRCR